MRTNRSLTIRIFLLASFIVGLALTSTRLHADTGTCGGVTTTLPFNDVMSSPFFCQIAQAFFSGLTNGTSATTYSPSNPVTRDQMAAFITRTMDQSLKRGSKRAALRQFWTPQGAASLGLTTVGINPFLVESDGADLWVANNGGSTVSRVRASDGSVLGTWTSAGNAIGVLVAMGKVLVTGFGNPGSLYEIDPTTAPGAVTLVSSGLGAGPGGIAFDGTHIWIANGAFSLSKVTVNPLSVTNVTGFSNPQGLLFDGSNIWLTDQGDNKLKQLDGSGNILQSISVGAAPEFPAFDGTDIWVPNNGDNTVTVVRASTGVVLATLTGNGLNGPFQAAFDGQRVLVTNTAGNSVSLWKAVDLTPLGSFLTGTGTSPSGACSDGVNFWITLNGTNKLARF